MLEIRLGERYFVEELKSNGEVIFSKASNPKRPYREYYNGIYKNIWEFLRIVDMDTVERYRDAFKNFKGY